MSLQKIGLVTIQATAHHHCVSVNGTTYDCRIRKSDDSRLDHRPIYLDGVCRRAVVAVEYRVTHNGTGGVRKVNVHFQHRDVPDGRRPIFLEQKFGVRFVWASADPVDHTEVYGRSGKPGYTTGGPVLVTAVRHGDGKDVAKGYRPRPMDLPNPDERGACDVNSGRGRLPVNFLENVDVQCRIQVRRRRRVKRTEETGATFTELCHGIQNEVVRSFIKDGQVNETF